MMTSTPVRLLSTVALPVILCSALVTPTLVAHAAEGAAPEPSAAKVHPVFGDDGLSSLKVDGKDVLAEGVPAVRRVILASTYRNKNREENEKQLDIPETQDPYAGDDRTFVEGDAEPDASTFDADARTLTQTFEWGTLAVTYEPGDGRLDLLAEVANTSDKPIEQLVVDLLAVDLPGDVKPRIVSSEPHWARADASIGAPLIVQAQCAVGQAVVTSTDPAGPLQYTLARREKDGPFALRVTAGVPDAGGEVYDGVWKVRPIAPGKSDRWRVSLRFAPADADVHALTADAAAAFAERHPFLLDWPDRRPIGAVHIADGRTSEANPRGWKHGMPIPADWDVRTDENYEQFRQAALKGADRVIAVAKAAGLQGMIVWQPVGQEFTKATYYGEPRLLPWIAPEMEAAADDYFGRIHDAGLRTGICIRPQTFTPLNAEGERVAWKDVETIKASNWSHASQNRVFHETLDSIHETAEGQSPLELLNAKIVYAKERWGCTLFYVDTNHFWRPRDRSKEGWAWKGLIMPAEVFEELNRRHPDCLIIPEHEYAQYWASTAPYRQPPQWGGITPAGIRAIYPRAFSILTVQPSVEHVQTNLNRYVRGVVEGDILMVHGWFGGDDTAKLYRVAAELAPFRVTIAADGKMELLKVTEGNEPQIIAAPLDAKGLTRVLARSLPATKAVPPRRVWIVYDPKVNLPTVRSAVDAIAEAGGIIAWSSTPEMGAE